MSSMKYLITLTCVSLVCSSAAKKHGKQLDPHMFNFQSGIDFGSTMAGGMTFDKEHNRLFLTGGTYARGFFIPEANYLNGKVEMNSDCFFATVELANPEEDKPAAWNNPMRLGYVRDPEACSMVHYTGDHNRVFLGASASGESMGRVDIDGDVLPQLSDVSLFGEVISLSLDHVYNIAPVIPQHYLFGGHGFFQSEVNFPFAITSEPKAHNVSSEDDFEEEAIYVASLYSKYAGEWAEDNDEKEVDLTSPYIDGNVWGIAIQKIRINPSNATTYQRIQEGPTHMERVWMRNLETTNFQKLQTTDMVFVNGNLLLAGSTYDFGEQFAGLEREARNYQDYDGFLVKIDPETGELAESDDDTEKMTLRIQSRGKEADDIIHGICLHPANDEGYVPYVYVVGSTDGEMHDHDHGFSGGGFVIQIRLHDMYEMWKEEITGENIEGSDCAVTDDGKLLYVAGVALDGGALDRSKNLGGDDVWVQQYDVASGTENWQIQLGSDQDETLAKGGAIIVDSQNNAILYGNTRGSVGRVRAENLKEPDATNDIFVMTITADRGYLPPDPNTIFQIPRYYFDGSGTSHRIWIGCMVLAAIVLFVIVMSFESKWKPVSVSDALADLKDLLPKSYKKERMYEHDHEALDFTQSETEEEDGFADSSSLVSGVSSLRSMESVGENARNTRRQQLKAHRSNMPTLMASYPPLPQTHGKFEEEKMEIS